MVAFGFKSKAFAEAAGPIVVEPKVFWKPIVERETPTEEGFVNEV
jgi:hypothetical protein